MILPFKPRLRMLARSHRTNKLRCFLGMMHNDMSVHVSLFGCSVATPGNGAGDWFDMLIFVPAVERVGYELV
jgi:hypothetical protein